jgi:hypothetical protein
MSFGLFSQPEIPRAQADSFSDAEKNKIIVEKLFNKRKAIIWNLENRGPEMKEAYAEELRMNDLDLAAFGLTKIDYEVYLAKNKETIH